MQLYSKNESGEYEPATEAQLNEVFKEKSNGIVAKRIAEIREAEVKKATEEARPKLEQQLREELTAKIKGEVEAELKPQIDEANKAKGELEIALRRKTVAAEFGFKPETEEFLGSGSEEDMRAKAETLKSNFGAPAQPQTPEKTSGEQQSSLLEKTGLDIKL